MAGFMAACRLNRRAMMDKTAIENEMRIYAVEWLCTAMAALLLRSSGQESELLSEMREQAIVGARAMSLSQDPAMADHYSAELEGAIDRLLGMTAKLLGKS
jgi:hypothetical protein